MGDAIAVFGSRIGIAWDPKKKASYLIRHTDHPGLPLNIYAGIQVGERRLVLPLAPEGENFAFCDQTMTPTTMALGAIDPVSGIHISNLVLHRLYFLNSRSIKSYQPFGGSLTLIR
jgi:hypothetical protein